MSTGTVTGGSAAFNTAAFAHNVSNISSAADGAANGAKEAGSTGTEVPVEASRPRLPFLAGFLGAFFSSFLPAASAADLASPLSFLRRFTMGLHGRRKAVRTRRCAH